MVYCKAERDGLKSSISAASTGLKEHAATSAGNERKLSELTNDLAEARSALSVMTAKRDELMETVHELRNNSSAGAANAELREETLQMSLNEARARLNAMEARDPNFNLNCDPNCNPNCKRNHNRT